MITMIFLPHALLFFCLISTLSACAGIMVDDLRRPGIRVQDYAAFTSRLSGTGAGTTVLSIVQSKIPATAPLAALRMPARSAAFT
jgi:hypothetical protein